MRLGLLQSTAMVVALCAAGFAQGRGPSTRKPGPGITFPSRPGIDPNNQQSGPSVVFFSGKVVVDDGTTLTDKPAIQSICKGQIHTEAYADSHGGFSFEARRQQAPTSSTGMDITDAESSISSPLSTRTAQRDWRECQLRASLPGFTSEVLELSARPLDFGNTDVGRIVLHRMGNVAGLTLSATTAAAPSDARKAFEKAIEKERKNKPGDAEKLLEKAVQIYPRFAAAWFKLGRLQSLRNDSDAARESYQHAIAADEKYVSPYQGLAQLASNQKHWGEVVQFTSKVLALNPINFPDAWFLNSVGNYFLQNFAIAEKSAREGLRLDSEHHVPKLDYLLGIILMQNRHFPEATQHLQRYLGLTKNPAEVQQTQKLLAQITELTASNHPAPSRQK